ncbi:hypothetical protein B9Z55_010984 [Caenorhabditis nigoni]|uniref:F-box associated domain-containing protein n=1 Tax=Caenorhabditis nigoni TaxID=1611254 RepID=A0A2G5UIQ8_9PELO|nr:hypothetical protein B9Z55_010984 [Caenorhabditis nigoni]
MSTPSDEELEGSKRETTVMTISPENVQTEGAFQFSLFADLLHGVGPGNNGHHRRRYRSEEPNGNDMNSLVEFEKWNELNDDCRMEVVKYLNYNDRCKLGICSKRDYETVKSTPLDVYSVSIESYSMVTYDNLTVTVHFHNDYNPGNKIQLIFSQHGEDTLVRWLDEYLKFSNLSAYYGWEEKLSDSERKRVENGTLVLKSCNYEEEAVKFAEKWMKKCNFELEDIKIEMNNYPMDKSQIKSLPKCKSITIGADDAETFRWWIQKLPKQMENIKLIRLTRGQEVFIPPDLLNAPQIMQTLEFDFWCRADFSDEQFLNLKANTFEIDCVNITDQGINEYIKKWVNGNGAPDFRRAILRITEDRNFDEMTRGIEYKEFGDFNVYQSYGFCRFFFEIYEPLRCVQICSKVDPYESITLSITSDDVAIQKTGHRKEKNGETYSEFSIPW